MECHVYQDRIHLHSLNEFVVRNRSSQVVHLSVDIAEKHLQDFSGDGLIISSSAGSTAYNYSAGGAILYPTLDGYQLTPLAPLNTKAYRSLYNSIVVPNDTVMDIYPERHIKALYSSYPTGWSSPSNRYEGSASTSQNAIYSACCSTRTTTGPI